VNSYSRNILRVAGFKMTLSFADSNTYLDIVSNIVREPEKTIYRCDTAERIFDKAEDNKDACCLNRIEIRRQRITLDAILLETTSTKQKYGKIAVRVGCPDLKIIPHP
jgi:hypothetical protein